MRVLLALLLVTAASAPAHAGDNELTIGSFSRALHTSSANAVTSDSLGGGHLAYGRALRLDLMPGLALWVAGEMTWGGATGTLFQSMSTEIDMLGFTAGGRAVYTLHPRLAVSGRLDVGTARTELTVHGAGQALSDAAWAGIAGTGIGVDLLAMSRPRFSLGLRFELGYVTATAPALSPHAAADDGKIELDAMQASIGSLDLGGRYLSFSVLSQF